MRPFDATTAIETWTDDDLLVELDVALRTFAGWPRDLPDGPQTLAAVARVRRAHEETVRRRLDLTETLRTWSDATGWRMDEFLRDTLGYPGTVPRVRLANELRLDLACWMCNAAEHAERSRTNLCSGCLNCVLAMIRARRPEEPFVLYRTYNPDHRCEHADADTVLAIGGWDPFSRPGWCERCLLEELASTGA